MERSINYNFFDAIKDAKQYSKASRTLLTDTIRTLCSHQDWYNHGYLFSNLTLMVYRELGVRQEYWKDGRKEFDDELLKTIGFFEHQLAMAMPRIDKNNITSCNTFLERVNKEFFNLSKSMFDSLEARSNLYMSSSMFVHNVNSTIEISQED